jgi:uncharacterized protein (UPF0248 family)
MSQSRSHARPIQRQPTPPSKTAPNAGSPKSFGRHINPHSDPKSKVDIAVILRSHVFLSAYTHYIRIDISCKQLPTESPHFLVQSIFNNVNSLSANVAHSTRSRTILWPGLFVVSQFDGLISKEAEQDRGCYLIGLEGPVTDELLGEAKEQMQSEEKEIRGRNIDFKDYDPVPTLSTHLVTREELGLLEMDQWIYPEITSIQFPLVFSEGSFPDGNDASDLLAAPEGTTPDSTPVGHVPSGETLKPVQEQINRIRWDKSLDADDYAIVYEDRFDGLMERDIAVLTGETTDEAFIPQSRMRSIKRKSTGQTVWHRNERIDLLSLD